MDHRAPPPPPPLQPQLELSLSTVVPQKRRWSARTRRNSWQVTIPVVLPPPAAFPVPSAPHQIPAPPAAAGPPADADNLLLLAHTAVSQADAEAEASSPSPPAPAVKKLCSSPPVPLAAAADEGKEKLYAPPLPALAVGVDHQNPSFFSAGHADAATKASAVDCKKAACPQGDAAGSSKGDHSSGGVASPAAAASPQPQPWDDDEELEPGEIPPEKPAAGCNADSALESLLSKEETAAGEEAKATIAREPAAMGSNAHRAPAVVNRGVVVRRDGKHAATEMSAAEERRMREVFVGGLSRDATEEDVRAVLSAAGQISEVRMILDRTKEKNKGYCFVTYRDAAMASKAVAEFGNVKICGKRCRVAVPDGNEKANKIAQRDPTIEDYNRIYEQGQPSPTLAVQSSYISWDHYAIPASSYVVPPVGAIPVAHYIPVYHNGNGVYLPAELNHGQVQPWGSQMGQSGSSRPPAGQPPHRRRRRN